VRIEDAKGINWVKVRRGLGCGDLNGVQLSSHALIFDIADI
jgi:hypothetical protein